MGVAGIGAIMAPLNRLASLWLVRNPGLAIGIVSAGGAAGQGLVPYFPRHLIVTEGWRTAYLTLGVLFIAVMIPLALLLRDAPRPTSSARRRTAVRRRRACSRCFRLPRRCAASAWARRSCTS